MPQTPRLSALFPPHPSRFTLCTYGLHISVLHKIRADVLAWLKTVKNEVGNDGDFRHFGTVDNRMKWSIFHFNFIGVRCFQGIKEMAFPV